ncbi:MAG TPA: class I SAM-dependent methyltransferase, partial [Hanamia sp.]|nr:class I SAM-dependent methyltransferase [Hanamia sp.]
VYRSSISQGYKDHCRNMAIDLKERFGLTNKSFHIDIAGNDCALLSEFKNVIGCDILNVDPAKNLAGICMAANIPSLNLFWGLDAAKQIINSGNPKADLITATNVFAHVDDVSDFIKGVKYILKENGHLVLEFPYLINFIEGKEFDTIYFEHLSYFLINPIKLLCEKEGLKIERVESHPIHGGSVRVFIGNGKEDETVYNFLESEHRYRSINPYMEFAREIKRVISDFRLNISKLSNIAAFAASAKGNTLLNSSGITVGKIRYIVDETPEKIGKFSPGTHIPIVSMLDLQRTPPDYLLILSWNFAEEIMDKCRKAGYNSKFIIPIPEFKIIE